MYLANLIHEGTLNFCNEACTWQLPDNLQLRLLFKLSKLQIKNKITFVGILIAKYVKIRTSCVVKVFLERNTMLQLLCPRTVRLN